MLSRRGLLLVAAGGLFGCRRRRRSAEDEIRDALVALETAVEEKDVAAVRELISERFAAGDLGDRREALALLSAVLARHPHIHLLTRIVAVELETAARAQVKVLVAAAGHPIEGVTDIARVSADILNFELVMAKESPGRWRVLSAAWQAGQPQDFLGSP